MKTQKTYRKVFVNGKEENLPKKKCTYWAKAKSDGMYMISIRDYERSNKNWWLTECVWYFLPIQEQPRSTRKLERDIAVIYENFLKDNDIQYPSLELDLLHKMYAKIYCEIGSQSIQEQSVGEVQEFMNDVHKWADSVFGTERTALAPLYHLKEEVDEVISEMKKGFPGLTMKEMADCFTLVLDATSKYGYTFAQLLEIAKEKMIVNKARNWGKPDKNGVCQHIQEQPVETPTDEDILEPIQNALYSAGFSTNISTGLANGILQYMKDAGFAIITNTKG